MGSSSDCPPGSRGSDPIRHELGRTAGEGGAYGTGGPNADAQFDADVLIVGAGPSGLVLALEVTHLGLSCIVLERNPGPVCRIDACLLTPRTLEMLECTGVLNSVLDSGLSVLGYRMWSREGPLLHIDPTDVNAPFPRPVALEQHALERLLSRALLERGRSIFRSHELLSVEQDATGVSIRVRDEVAGTEKTMRGRWLAACDGAFSRVRASLGIPFNWDERDTETVLHGEAEIDWALPPSVLHAFQGNSGYVNLTPLAPHRRYQIAAIVSGSSPGLDSLVSGTPDPAELEQFLASLIHTPFRVLRASRFKLYRIRRGGSESFRRGRVFLVGDAAQVHSVTWSVGLNAGIGDAVNLGWKLALLRRRPSAPMLSESYDVERREARMQLAREVDSAATQLARSTRFGRWMRSLSHSVMQTVPPLRRKMAERVARLGWSYGTGPLVSGEAPDGEQVPGPGARVPDVPLRAPSGRDVRLFDVLRQDNQGAPSFTLLVFAMNEHTRKLIDKELLPLERSLSYALSAWYVVWDTSSLAVQPARTFLDPERRAHRAFGASEPTLVLVRPDGYVGFRVSPPDLSRLKSYLAGVLGLPEYREQVQSVPLAGSIPALFGDSG